MHLRCNTAKECERPVWKWIEIHVKYALSFHSHKMHRDQLDGTRVMDKSCWLDVQFLQSVVVFISSDSI